MKTLIKEVIKTDAEGVLFSLTNKAALNSGLKSDQWYVSWDTIGRALFKDQYYDADSVADLRKERGEHQ